MSNVHRLDVKPKLTTHKYRRHDITVTYIPNDKEFKWHFLETRTMAFSGREPTADAALKAAKMQVDELTQTETGRA